MLNKFIKIIDDIEEGNINPLTSGIYKQCVSEFKNIEALFLRIKEMAEIEAESWSKEELIQYGFERRNGRAIYAFKSDKEYSEKLAELKKIEMEIKIDKRVQVKYAKDSLIIKK